jgi:hypothetical protein
MEITKRNSINDKLKKYTYSGDENDVIEITEWANGDGVDIAIAKMSGDNRIFSLSYDELDAIDYLIKTMKYNK